MLSDSGMGAVQLGETATTVKEKCDVFTDTVEMNSHGMPHRVLTVSMGLGSLKAETMNDKVTRLVITDTLLRADDGYGVNTTMQAMRLNPTLTATRDESAVIMRVATHCGISFELDKKFAGLVKGTPITATALAVVPDSARVKRVLIVGCR